MTRRGGQPTALDSRPPLAQNECRLTRINLPIFFRRMCIFLSRHTSRGGACALLAAVVLATGAPAAWAVAPQITHHELEVVLDPDTHWLAATDRMHVVWDPTGGRPVNFLLSDALKVEAIRLEDDTELDWTVSAALGGRQQVTVLLPPSAPRQLRIVVVYRGAIADAVQPATDLSFIAGDRTTGIIGTDGVYLSGDAAWTPAGPDALATYRIGVTVPDGWQVCTQGQLVRDGADRGGWRSEWLTTVPSDGLALVAGHYVVERRRFGELTVATYLFAEHAGASDQLADAAAKLLTRFSELLGPYPFDEFAIVENFFSSGYAFPGFTLLGREVLANPRRLLEPGYLDHEIVHNWWGNGVFVDEREGNWSEALATYYANYLAHEREGAEAAAQYRRRGLLRFSLHAPAGADYPLAVFESKTTPLDDAVGYMKGAMLWHQLRRAVGDDVFWPTMREVAQAHIGTRAGWSTFINALQQRSGLALEQWVGQWLHRAGAPQLRLEEVTVTPAPNGYRLDGVVVQDGEPYALTLPVRVDTSRGPLRAVLPVSDARTRFSLPVSGMPVRLTVDPDAHVFRRIPAEGQTPCLNRTLYGGDLLCVFPEDPRDQRTAIYRRLAEQAASDRKGRAVPVSEVTSRLLKDRSLLVFGDPGTHPVLRRVLQQAGGLPTIDAHAYTLNGVRHAGKAEAVLATAPRRDGTAATVTVYAGNSPAALERAHLLFFYGWDSRIRFEQGRPVERTDVPPTTPPLTWDGVASLGPAPAPPDVQEVVEYLADPWLLGRLTGQQESVQARRFLATRFAALGLGAPASAVQEFVVPDPRVLDPEPRAVLASGRGEVAVPVWPVWWSAPGAAEGDVMFAGYGWADTTWNDYRRQQARKRIVVVFGGGPPGLGAVDHLDALVQQALTAQERGAGGLVVVVPQDAVGEYLPAIALPFADLPWPTSRRAVERTGAAPGEPALALRASRFRHRRPPPGATITIPVWLMPWDAATAPEVGTLQLLRWRTRLESGRVSTVARVRRTQFRAPAFWRLEHRTGANVVGLLEGSEAVLKDEVIVVGAHYDHLGLADNGEVFRGADDNASGVAALLAAAQLLTRQKGQLRRSVLFAAFDAEEWGLVGSRAFLDAGGAKGKRIVAMINVDSIGRNVENTLYVIGGSRHPDLGALARGWAAAFGFTIGRNLDAFAYAHGSDHWPFAERGIPALTLFASDYSTLDTLGDVPEATDPVHIARVAHVLSALVYELATRPGPAPVIPVSALEQPVSPGAVRMPPQPTIP